MQNKAPQSNLDQFTWRLYLKCARPLSRGLRRSAKRLVNVAQRMNRISGELLFAPLPGDLYIASYPRSGTTWLQMILYQLTTDGEMAFNHISEFIPFFERSLTIGQNLNSFKPPRLFKTHLRYGDLPRGPHKYIYIARDGRDVLASYFHFYRSHMRYKGTFEAFFEAFIHGKVGYGSWFQHLAEWERHAQDSNVLFLRYEDLASDLPLCVRRIAAFCELSIPESRYEIICERCSFAYMKRYESKFDFMSEVLWERGFREGAFLRQGKMDSWWLEFTREQTARFETASECWQRVGMSRRGPRIPKLSQAIKTEKLNLDCSIQTEEVENPAEVFEPE